MKKVEIVKELEETAEKMEKRYNRGGSFSPFKYHKFVDGKDVPVYFIGAPGLAVAVSATLTAAALFWLITLPFKLYYWIPFVLVVAFVMRLAVKIDKARQIRSFCADLILRAIKSIKKYNETGDKELLDSALKFLNESNKWLYDENIEKQIKLIKEVE